MAQVTFILGGARSGKSAYAEQLAGQCAAPKLYIATAEPHDAEMAERIEDHRRRRGPGWDTLEIPVALPETLLLPDYSGHIILVDCLTLWLSNLMLHHHDIQRHTHDLIESLLRSPAQILLVSNEVGLGIVPDNALARQFRDAAGMLHQRVAAATDRVVWMVAGIPTLIKGA